MALPKSPSLRVGPTVDRRTFLRATGVAMPWCTTRDLGQ